MTAQEGKERGFVNEIIYDFGPNSDWFDPNIIPAIPKLLQSDLSTIVNSM